MPNNLNAPKTTRVNVAAPERASEPLPAAAPIKKVSHKPSITGIILALLSLISSGIANLFIHMKYTPTGPTTGSVDREVGHAVATGTTTILGTIFGLPFMIGAIFFGLLGIIFIVIRLYKVKTVGAILSVIAILIAVWGIGISIGLFDLIKAHPQ